MSKGKFYKYEDIYSSSKYERAKAAPIANKSYHNAYDEKRKMVNIVVIIMSTLCALFGGVLLFGTSMLASVNTNHSFSYVESNYDSEEPTGDATFTNNIIKDPMVLNIMVFGSDVRPNKEGNGNSDSMILVSIDNRHKKFKMTSFMRDSFVYIPGYERAKLNAAYSRGGPELAIQTIERNFGVDVDRFAVLYFDTFPEIIDALDGVDVELKKEEAQFLYDNFPDRVPRFRDAGTYHLSGPEALLYSRIRYVGNNDFERTQRQRYLISQLMQKFSSVNDPRTIANLMTTFLPALTTNISVDEMAGLAKNSIKYFKYPSSEFRVPSDDNFSFKRDVTWGEVINIDDMNKAREDIARFIYEETADSIYGTTSSSVPEIKQQ